MQNNKIFYQILKNRFKIEAVFLLLKIPVQNLKIFNPESKQKVKREVK
jgi:hypothetical protein